MSDVLVRVLRPLRPALEARGADLDALLADHGLSPRRLWLDPCSRIPWNTFAEVLEAAADRLGGPEALDAIGADRLIRNWQALVALVSRYITPFPAFQLGVRWFCPAIFRGVRGELWEIPGGLAESVFTPAGRRESVEFFWLVRGVMRQFPTLIGWETTTIEFAHHERRADYRLQLVPAGANRGVVSGGVIAADLECDLAELAALALAPGDGWHCEDSARGNPVSVANKLRRLLRDESRWNDYSLPEAARRLAMSGRTLERSLAAEGTSYREIREEVRFELASTLLRRGATVEEISDQLGFLDVTSFHRAFRRWAGTSPGAFRREMVSGVDGRNGQDSVARGHSRTLP